MRMRMLGYAVVWVGVVLLIGQVLTVESSWLLVAAGFGLLLLGGVLVVDAEDERMRLESEYLSDRASQTEIERAYAHSVRQSKGRRIH